MMTRITMQEAFDKAAIGVLTQGQKSADDYDCVYINELDNGDTLKCAVGHLLKNDEMCWNWVRRGIGGIKSVKNHLSHKEHLIQTKALKEAELDHLPVEFLQRLQETHDFTKADGGDQRFIDGFKAGMLATAQKFDLSSAVLDLPMT